MTTNKFSGIWVCAFLILSAAGRFVCAAEYTNALGGDWEVPGNWDTGLVPSSSDDITIAGSIGGQPVVVDADSWTYLSNNSLLHSSTEYRVNRLFLGGNETASLDIDIGTGNTWKAITGSTYYVGGQSGSDGTLNVLSGNCVLEASQMRIAQSDGSTGRINIIGADTSYIAGRESGGTSVSVGTGGNGTLYISAGTFQSRAGVTVASSGTFEVAGSDVDEIGVGSYNSLDGNWQQDAGGILKVGIDSGGVTSILIDDQDDDGTGGDVIFNNGALLEPNFLGGHSTTGQWTVMIWEGNVIDHGLSMSPGVTDYQWEFYITNHALVVTYGYASPPDLNQPQELSATAENDQITLGWSAVSNATGYSIKRSLSSDGPYTLIGTAAANQYLDTGLTSRTEYFYVVSSTVEGAESEDSEELSVITTGFVHPGGLFKQSDLERIRHQIEHRIDPWYTSFLELQAYSRSTYNYSVQGDSYTTVARGGENGNAWLQDADAAYCNALMWMITQDVRHAEKCVEIFNEWKTLTNVQGGGTESLNAGLFAWKMVEAAEIIKSTYSGWSESDIQAFKDMLVYPGYSDTAVPGTVTSSNGSFYWRIYKGDSGRHGNQDAIAWRSMMTMGVFLDNEKMYQRALRYFTHQPGRSDDIPMPTGPSPSGSQSDDNEYFTTYNYSGSTGAIADYGYNGTLTNLFWENGQCQESSRDQSHTFFNMAIVAGIADVAWNQGDAVWTMFDNRLLKGFEYSAKYNASYVQSFPDQPNPWEPTGTNVIQRIDRSGRWYSKKINPYVASDFSSVSRGQFLDDKRPIYEQAVAHFGTRLGLSTNDYLWTLRSRDIAIDHDGYETIPGLAWIADQPGWGAICFRRPPLAAGDPVSGFVPGGIPEFAIHKLSGIIEAENYDWFAKNGEGHTYHDLTPTNSGGAYRSDAVDIATHGSVTYLTDLEAGEWLSYTVHVPANGEYGIKINYASANGNGSVQFDVGGVNITSERFLPATGSMTNWVEHTAAQNIPLTAGVHALRMYIGGDSNVFNLDRISMVPMLKYSFNGGSFDFSWPSNHPGWLLESQLNGLDLDWLVIPGSGAGNTWEEPVDPEAESEFFRLANP